MTPSLRPARPGDYPGVAALLGAAGLPLDGVAPALDGFVVATAADGRTIVGAAGLEPHGRVGLVRSVAVEASHRGIGLGVSLTRAVLDLARIRGITDLFLLTTTAQGFFPRFGFEVVPRSAVPAALTASAEFQGACPETAIVMRARVGD